MLSDEAEGKNVAVTLRDDTNSPASKLIYVLLGLLVIYVIVRGVVGAKGRPFWYDEILTVTIASRVCRLCGTLWGVALTACLPVSTWWSEPR